jgi:hypothetical protein
MRRIEAKIEIWLDITAGHSQVAQGKVALNGHDGGTSVEISVGATADFLTFGFPRQQK